MDTEKKVGESAVAAGNRGKGRKAGVPNKATTAFRETINRMLEANSENVSIWLAQVAADDPAKALDLISKLAEYAAPKLSRTEHTGEDGGPVELLCKWQD